MQLTISCLLKACQQNDISYRVIDPNGHCVVVDDKWYFQANRTPFNSESMASLCKDKEHQYHLLKDSINMPKTKAYLDINIEEKYRHYLKYPNLNSIIESIEQEFDYPLVIKANSGALGVNVFFCHQRDEVEHAVQTIFAKDFTYDYIALAQQYIKPKKELRVIFFDGEPMLSYERYFEKDQFGARYWETEQGKAICLDNDPLVARSKADFAPIFTQPGLRFVGLDIIVDESDQLWLLELNSGPKVNHFVENNGEAAVIEMYSRILQRCC